MPVQSVTADPICCTGFEHGVFTCQTPSDANITIQSTTKRTGTYALKINAQSGTNSSFSLATGATGTWSQNFFRGYLYIATLPGSTRAIYNFSTTVVGSTTAPSLRLRSTGILEFYNGTSAFGVGSQVLSTGTWYRIAVGGNTWDDTVSLRIDGVTDIDWCAPGGGLALGSGGYVGALDTVASAFEIYWDDIRCDGMDWPGPGRGARIALTGAGSLTAGTFTIGGSSPAATKWQSINEMPTDDATTFVITGTTNNARETYTLASLPADCVEVRAVQYVWRHRRSGASSGTTAPTLYYTGLTGDLGVASSTASFSWQGCVSRGSQFPVGGLWTKDRFQNVEIGIVNRSTNSSDVSTLGIEIDYDDTVGALPSIRRQYITGYEAGDLTSDGSQVVGTVSAATNVARTGTYSLRVNPAGSTASYVRSNQNFIYDSTGLEYFFHFYVYVTTRPSAGNTMRLCSATSVGTHEMGARMDSAGKVQLDDKNGVIGSLSSAVIPLTTWTRIDVRLKASSTSTASNGIGEIKINGTTATSSTAMNCSDTIWLECNIGTTLAPGTGGCDVNFDDVVVDSTAWVAAADDVRVVDLVPTANGSFQDAGGGVSGVANKWDALDETPANDDTDYITTGTVSAVYDSYVMSDLPGNAGAVRSAATVIRHKRDGATNGSLACGVTLGTKGDNNQAGAFSTGSSYAWHRDVSQTTQSIGAWTVSAANSIEFMIQNGSANKSRISNARLAVEYALTTDVTISLPLSTMTLQAFAPSVPAPTLALPLATMTMQAYAPSIRFDYAIAIPKASMTLQGFDMTSSFILIPFNWFTAGMFVNHPYHVLPIASPPYDTDEFEDHAFSTRMFTKDDL